MQFISAYLKARRSAGPATVRPASPPDGAAHHVRVADPASDEAIVISAFEDAAIGMAIIACDSGRRLHVNQALCRMFGYTRTEMLSRAKHANTHPEDVPEDVRQRGRCIAGLQQGFTREKRYVHADGRVLWGHLTCSLVRDASGQPLHFVSQVQDITERKMAEEALRKSEERFRSLTMLSSDWYWEQDEQLRFVAFIGTQQAGPWLPDQKTGIGRMRWELDGVVPLRGTWDDHRAALAARQPFYNFQYMRQRHGEPVCYLTSSGEPMYDQAGRFTGYRGTARDITQDKLAERELRDAQTMLQLAAQIGRLGAWAWAIGDPAVTLSEEACAIRDVNSGSKPLLRDALACFAPPYERMMRRVLLTCARDGTPFDVEAPIVTARNRRRWVRVIGEAQWNAQGRVQRILGALQDISESRRAAEETRILAEQLSTTLESLTDAFYTVDRDWRFTYVNAEAERLMQVKRSEVLGKRVLEVFPELEHTVFPHFQRAMDDNVTVQLEEYYGPYRIWVQVKLFPSKQGLAIDLKDITERVRAQQEILRLNAELEERVKERTAQLEAANKDLEAFSYSIAHDLRAPLSSIDGFSRMLEHTAAGELPERCHHFIGRIRAGVSQMADLTDGLLSLAHLSRAALRDEPVDLAAMARAAVASCRERAPQRCVDIEIAQALPARGDRRLLDQVMANLIGNAWKFTSHRERARIEVGIASGPGVPPVYFVRDDGAGFDMAHSSKMFEAFQRMHTSAEFEGTGIGLATVHKVISRHGGRIWAEAAPGRGACFYFTLGQSPAGTAH
jgi:PAS domain S-box-containing protein